MRGIYMSIVILLCAALVVSASQCGQLIVQPPENRVEIMDYAFEHTRGNISIKICGIVPNSVAGTPLGMWLDLSIVGQPVPLEIFAEMNYTDPNGMVYPIRLTTTNLTYYEGTYPVHLLSEYNYQVGTYDVVHVTARKMI